MTASLRELLARGERTEAEQQARKRLSQAPQDVEALATLASLQLERGSFSMARSTLAQAAPADRSRWELRWVAAMLDVSESPPDAAQTLLARLWREHPDKAEVGYAWGTFLANQGLPDRAREPLTRAVTLAPDHGLYHFALATVLLELGEPAVATRHLQDTVRLLPSHTAAYAALARLLLLEDKAGEARRLLEAARPVVDQPALLEGLLGSLRVGEGALAEGLALLERALNVFPDHAGFNADKARALAALDRTAELLAFCDGLERTGRGSTPTRLVWAAALERTRPAEALTLYGRVMEQDPSDWMAANNAGLLALHGSDAEAAPREARPLFELAFVRSDGRVEPALNLARTLALLGEKDKALHLAQQVVAAAPEGPLRDEARRVIRLLGQAS